MTALFLFCIAKYEILSQILSWKMQTIDFTRVMGCFCAGSIPVIRTNEKGLKSRFSLENQWFQALFFCHEIVIINI
jgi:hypothetical protein